MVCHGAKMQTIITDKLYHKYLEIALYFTQNVISERMISIFKKSYLRLRLLIGTVVSLKEKRFVFSFVVIKT